MNLDHACHSGHYNETPSISHTSVSRRRENSETERSHYEAHSNEEEWFSAEEEDCTDESRGEVEGGYYSSLQAEFATLNDDGDINFVEEQTETSGAIVIEPSAPDPEPDEFEIAHAHHQGAFEFYQQNINHEQQDDVLPHELDELHERTLSLTMEFYKEQTKQLGEEAVEIYRDSLLQTVDTCIVELREIAQARMESLTAVMSEDMRIIYSEMISQSRQLFIETASITDDVTQAYATAIDYAINTFDLATQDMTESKSIPRRLLLSEMSSVYKKMKRDQSVTTAEESTTLNRFHTVEQNNYITRPTFAQAVRSVVTTAPSGYGNEQSPYLEVNNASRHFDPDMTRELEEQLRSTLKNAEIEKMNKAVVEARIAYELVVSQRNDSSRSWVATRSIPAELHHVRMSHKKAQQAALQTFDQLTRDVDTLLVTDFRNELVSEFQQRQQKLEVSLQNQSLPLPFI